MRLMRLGRRHRPFYRINVIDSRKAQDGKIIERLGHFDPLVKDPDKQIILNHERAKYWLENGAVPSETMSQLLAKVGIEDKHAQKRDKRRQVAKTVAHNRGEPFTATEKIQAEKKAEAEAKAAEEAEAAKKAEEAEAAKKAEEEAKAAEEPKADEGEEKAE